MKWWLHLGIYVLGSMALFMAVGLYIIFHHKGLLPFSIFLLPIPVVIFHIFWRKVKAACVDPLCSGKMTMSSLGSVYYTCDKCGRIKQTIIKRSPQNR